MALYLEGEVMHCLLLPILRTGVSLQNTELREPENVPIYLNYRWTGIQTIKDGFWSANGSYMIGSFDGRNFVEEYRHITGSSIEAGYSYAAQT